MAQGLGIAMLPGAGALGSVKTGSASGSTTGTVASGSSSLVPWVSSALVAAGVVVGAYVTMLHEAKPITPPALPALSAPSAAPTLVAPVTSPSAVTPTADTAANAADEPAPKSSAPQSTRGSRSTPASELADQIALVDAARSALASGGAQRALSIAREYQTQYPSGTFRPEVAAVKIEALVKLGRTSEARTLAERFVVAYGPSPLAARVARLAQLAEP